ncbi:hypothetical protein [Cetobacterium sp.]
MKKLLTVAVLATLATTAMAVPPNLQPPVTVGGNGNTSSTEVRITANVVQGIAVNEASPIDFGNLARGMYTGIVNQNIPGKIHVKGSNGDKVKLKLNKSMTDLTWTGQNGTVEPANPGVTVDKDKITDVNVYGLSTNEKAYTLDTNGEATQILTASFTAGTTNGANLGPTQKLGSYVGTVLVTATKS